MNQDDIVTKAEELIKSIRNHSKEQKGLWQRIPHLALEADGKLGSGFKDYYSWAYNNGCWALASTISRGHYCVLVDLATGELVDADCASRRKFKPAKDYDVLRLALNLDKLDAQKIVASLEEEADKPDYNREWRAKKRSELGLPELYCR